MIKVLIIRDPSFSLMAGIQRHCNNIIELFKNDSDIEITHINLEAVAPKYLKIIRKWYFSFFKLKNEIENSNCDIVHIHGFASICVLQTLITSLIIKRKIVFTAHFHPFSTLENPFLGKLFFFLLFRPFIGKINQIIALNNEDSFFFRQFNKNITKIPNWINNEVDVTIKKNTTDHTKPNLLFIGRVEANKGINHLFSLPENKYRIYCVSNGNFYRKDFIFYNNISDEELNRLYSIASVVVVPSRYESFSFVALEALLHGIPIVISDRVRIIDYLKNISGIQVFPFNDYKAFNHAIEEVIGKKVDIDKVKSIFSKEIIKKSIKKVYFTVYKS